MDMVLDQVHGVVREPQSMFCIRPAAIRSVLHFSDICILQLQKITSIMFHTYLSI